MLPLYIFTVKLWGNRHFIMIIFLRIIQIVLTKILLINLRIRFKHLLITCVSLIVYRNDILPFHIENYAVIKLFGIYLKNCA